MWESAMDLSFISVAWGWRGDGHDIAASSPDAAGGACPALEEGQLEHDDHRGQGQQNQDDAHGQSEYNYETIFALP